MRVRVDSVIMCLPQSGPLNSSCIKLILPKQIKFVINRKLAFDLTVPHLVSLIIRSRALWIYTTRKAAATWSIFDMGNGTILRKTCVKSRGIRYGNDQTSRSDRQCVRSIPVAVSERLGGVHAAPLAVQIWRRDRLSKVQNGVP